MALAGKTNEAKYLLTHSLASYHTGTFVIPNQQFSYMMINVLGLERDI